MNADDFGLSESVNRGIVECFNHGIVTSTTVMMNQKGLKHAIKLYQKGLIPEVGLHFTVTSGKPLLPAEKVPSLIDTNGWFLDKHVLMTKKVSEEEVYQELHAQYDAAIQVGFAINHIDSHHFAGVYPPLKNAFIRFSNKTGLPVRRVDNIISGQETLEVPTPDAFDSRFFDSGVSLEQLKTILLERKKQYPNGVIELMCHPSARDNSDLDGVSSYTTLRSIEREILTSPELMHWLKEAEITCVGFDVFQ